MNKEIYYTSNDRVNKRIRKEFLIPYRISSPDYRLKTNKSYYCNHWNQCFTVISKEFSDEKEFLGYYIQWEDGKYGFYSSAPEIYMDLILEEDINNITNTKNIINNNIAYTGAEIIYWFFIHNINAFNKKYRGFWKYVDTYSKFRLSDNSKYKLYGKIVNGVYDNCKIVKASR